MTIQATGPVRTGPATGPTLRVRTLIADANLVMRLGLRAMLDASEQILVVGDVDDGSGAVQRAERLCPDVVVVGAGTGGPDGCILPRLNRKAGVLVLSGSDEPRLVEQAFRDGATSYLVHGQFTTADLISAVVSTAERRPYLSPGAVSAVVESFRSSLPGVTAAVSGTAVPPEVPARAPRPPADHPLSRREAELMAHVMRGRTNGEIARTLFISEKTVKNHINHIYTKLGARNRAEAMAIWLGFTDTDRG
ncbi:LuxR family two component transcriptional regulator [Krasilnikovia cinnamomea]|uniref:LuxR family two component transcriptional regulator n=1 Tax=Krasilnikovia cinnamomea TaxID=349313 RepID=A0A4Q7ZRN4_9ACTN|nr:response regulator transcription factor [Krasilnikovia cinnamomea]RZU53471.1 LuxR family two component transcriptional regulator [Krasilnikovia cinnamomea]